MVSTRVRHAVAELDKLSATTESIKSVSSTGAPAVSACEAFGLALRGDTCEAMRSALGASGAPISERKLDLFLNNATVLSIIGRSPSRVYESSSSDWFPFASLVTKGLILDYKGFMSCIHSLPEDVVLRPRGGGTPSYLRPECDFAYDLAVRSRHAGGYDLTFIVVDDGGYECTSSRWVCHTRDHDPRDHASDDHSTFECSFTLCRMIRFALAGVRFGPFFPSFPFGHPAGGHAISFRRGAPAHFTKRVKHVLAVVLSATNNVSRATPVPGRSSGVCPPPSYRRASSLRLSLGDLVSYSLTVVLAFLANGILGTTLSEVS